MAPYRLGLRMVTAPIYVATYLLAGTVLFQILLYLRYGQSIFDNMDLPGADFVWFQHSPAILRWPAQLTARALHLWQVQPTDAIVVMVTGTGLFWIYAIAQEVRSNRSPPILQEVRDGTRDAG